MATEVEWEYPAYGRIEFGYERFGRAVNGTLEKAVNETHDETLSPVLHVPNKSYVVRHVHAVP